MSCGVALAVSLLLTDPNIALAAALPPAAADAPVSVAGEPLFAEIVTRSTAMRGIVSTWLSAGAADNASFGVSPEFERLRHGTTLLAERDMQGHLILKERGTDGDLKCILRGIAEDMPSRSRQSAPPPPPPNASSPSRNCTTSSTTTSKSSRPRPSLKSRAVFV
jgi:hypothetical protein